MAVVVLLGLFKWKRQQILDWCREDDFICCCLTSQMSATEDSPNLKGAGIPNVVGRKGALNAPGAWHFMISYTQRSDRGVALATKLEKDLAQRGYSIWLDVNMKDKSEAAMKEAVEHSMVVLAVITGGTPNLEDENAYLKRDFCLSELRWAFAAIRDPTLPLKHLQPVINMHDKERIGALMNMAPDDLQHMRNIDFIDLNTTDLAYWKVGVDKIFEKAEDAGAAFTLSGAAHRSEAADDRSEVKGEVKGPVRV